MNFLDEPFIQELYKSLLKECVHQKAVTNIPSPGIEIFAVISVKLVIILSLKIGEEEIVQAVCSALKSNFYEARLAVLNFLKKMIEPDSLSDSTSSIESLVIPLNISSSKKSSLLSKILQSDEIAETLASFVCNKAQHLSCIVEVSDSKLNSSALSMMVLCLFILCEF